MHVLIIADNDQHLEWIKSPLQATGLSINVIYAHSIREAMSLLKSVKFDMILYDLAFSEKGMAENFTRLYASGSKAPLVVLTEAFGDPEAAQALQFGAATHIVKDRQRVSVMAESFKNILLQRDIVYN
ncbi:response regulator [Panacibacter sp. DH6]|uniref:Response regulator n=1 Tax=Panacibacter microcysteis TaxID=2793269 RepID=A0A931E834_9BACT|nr:response regulator [Panacibacter microcysteis]MBG9377015.1 response regulator [Panacibacter microcysteis]